MPSKNSPQRKNQSKSRSTINKRKLPDCDQISYFRLGFSSIFTAKSFAEQFSDFWHALPPQIRCEDEDETQNQCDEAQSYTLDEDEYKHAIRALPHLPTADLIVAPPHCLIRDKIETAVAHFQREHQGKVQSMQSQDGDDEHSLELNMSRLQTEQNTKKRRLSQDTLDDFRRRRGKRVPKQEFVVDDSDELEVMEPLNTAARKSWRSDKQEMDAEDEADLFVIKSEEPNNNNDDDDAGMTPTTSPRRSARVRALKASKGIGNNLNAEETDVSGNNVSVPASPSKTVEEMKEDLAQFEQHKNEEPILRRRRGAPKNNNNRRKQVQVLQVQDENETEVESTAAAAVTTPTSKQPRKRTHADMMEITDEDDDDPVSTPAAAAAANSVASPSRSKSKSKSASTSLTPQSSRSSAAKKGARAKVTHDRPHVLFASNVEMPFYDQLIVPFRTFQDRRKQFKAVQSKKEINSITKLTRNHRLQCVEAEKGCKLLREHQCVLQVSIFHSNKTSERYTKSHEYVVLSNQKLSELKDALYCLMDRSPVAKNLKNSFFFIEDTFYDDMRHSNAVRLSDEIVQWSKTEEHWKQTGVYLQKDMEHVKFEDLNIRLGSHYMYCHHGDCQHVVIFTDCRIATKWDCRNSYAYPVCTFRQILKRQKCGVCEMYPAKFVTYNDKHTPVNPFFFCERCYHPFHYDQHGELLYDDFQVFDYVHD